MEVTSVPCGPTNPMIPHMSRVSFLLSGRYTLPGRGQAPPVPYTGFSADRTGYGRPLRSPCPLCSLHHRKRIVLVVANRVCALSSQGNDVPWRLPADDSEQPPPRQPELPP